MRTAGWLVFILLIFIYVNNTSVFFKARPGKPILLAHRGLAQTFYMAGITGKTNTARRIYKPEHPYLENTIASMEAAFSCGADVVEFDIHLTKDSQFAVFHDEDLEYRTNATGTPAQHTLPELQALDVGYGYTADSGKTYPFRGKGIGLMPSLPQVLAHFPQQELLIHVKDDEAIAGEKLAACLQELPKDRLTHLSVFGADKPIAKLKELMPDVRVTSKSIMEKALAMYFLLGWTGYVPAALKNTEIHLPQKYAPFLWGWPHRFISRMKNANTRVFLIKGNGKFSDGFDNAADIKEIPANYTGGIWTNRIDRVAPLFH